jgi:hypothetical protein
MFAKIIIFLLLLTIIYCLGSALFYMLSKKKNQDSMAKALSWRVGLSLGVFLLLMLGFYTGLIHPHGVSV